ncbi:competence protein CoiA [Aliibacillus thermotolerans]|uniref:Competence protein CoiA n=1 Tax=Aliibacillus thermotolerans TaxID=1834418 RepID=A0ABW0U584_9BACI|nr:competence protein CoiA family protein [Aliibacillus thermotolerans]MDA3129133.1 hypothetical protein [Aliibacillus thermotolerans]
MFIAKTKENEQVSLIPPISPTFLEKYSPPFYCPVCQQEVILKTGNHRRWHFAHLPQKACPVSHKGESEMHREAKMILYQWLRQQKVRVEMEKYFPKIERQADLFLQWQSKNYVIEYQQSPLSPEEMLKRTTDYLSLQIEPIWMYGKNRLRPKRYAQFSIQPFEWIGLRERRDDQRHAFIYFSPQTASFSFLFPRTTVQRSTIFADYYTLPLSKATISHVVHLPKTIDAPLDWNQEWLLHKWSWRYQRIRWQPYPDITSVKQLLLEQKADLSLYPSEAGWPTLCSETFATPIYVWQTIFLLQFLQHVLLYDTFSFSSLLDTFLLLIDHYSIQTREFPFISQPLEKSLFAYLELLTRMNVLQKCKGGWRKLAPLILPRAVDDGFRMDKRWQHHIF